MEIDKLRFIQLKIEHLQQDAEFKKVNAERNVLENMCRDLQEQNKELMREENFCCFGNVTDN